MIARGEAAEGLAVVAPVQGQGCGVGLGRWERRDDGRPRRLVGAGGRLGDGYGDHGGGEGLSGLGTPVRQLARPLFRVGEGLRLRYRREGLNWHSVFKLGARGGILLSL